eukprot:6190023-Prorocentrum_lima.AAC.1
MAVGRDPAGYVCRCGEKSGRCGGGGKREQGGVSGRARLPRTRGPGRRSLHRQKAGLGDRASEGRESGCS